MILPVLSHSKRFPVLKGQAFNAEFLLQLVLDVPWRAAETLQGPVPRPGCSRGSGHGVLNVTFLMGQNLPPLSHICPRTGSCCPVLAWTTRRDWSCLQALQSDFSFSSKPIIFWGGFFVAFGPKLSLRHCPPCSCEGEEQGKHVAAPGSSDTPGCSDILERRNHRVALRNRSAGVTAQR